MTRDLVPQPVDDALRTALARNPADRFATVAEFVRAITPVTRETPIVRRSLRRRWALITAGVAVTLALAWLAVRNRPLGAPMARTRLAVLPFTVRGDTGFEYLGEGIVDLLARNLDGAGDLRTVDPGPHP